MLYKEEIPIANSMIELAERADHLFQRYICYWVAFNNIYTLVSKRLAEELTIAAKYDLIPKLSRTGGEINYKINEWGYWFPEMKLTSERKQILATTNLMGEKTKNKIVFHRNISFFVDRIPKGVRSRSDSRGQLINGVLNITRTIESEYPVWSPIDTQVYQRVLKGDRSEIDILIDQIIMMLYTIRNNLVHGSKNPNEANDNQVVEMALPVLEIVVKSFIKN